MEICLRYSLIQGMQSTKQRGEVGVYFQCVKMTLLYLSVECVKKIKLQKRCMKKKTIEK